MFMLSMIVIIMLVLSTVSWKYPTTQKRLNKMINIAILLSLLNQSFITSGKLWKILKTT